MKPSITRLLLATLVCVSLASGQGPGLGVPHALPGDDLIGPAAGDQHQPGLALGGDVFLAVWTDWRADLSGTLGIDQGGSDIYARRLAADGAPLDTTPIVIALDAANQDEPSVAWNGSAWLVTWISQEPTPFFWASAVRGVRVSASGEVLDLQPLDLISYPFSSGIQYTVAGDGTGWLVVGQGTSAGEEDVVGVRLSAGGTLIDTPPKLLVDVSSLIFDPRIAFTQGAWLLVWREATAIRARRYDTNLSPLGGTFSLVGGSGSSNALDLTTNGVEFFAAWGKYTSSNQIGNVTATRISATGVQLDPGGIPVVTGSLFSQSNARVTWDGVQWIVSWTPPSFLSPDALRMARVSTSGILLDPGGVAVSPSAEAEVDEVRLAGGPTGGVQAIWTDRRAGGAFPQDVYTASYDVALTVGDEHVVSVGAPRQTAPAVASGAGIQLVVFKSERSGDQRILGQRVDAEGEAIDAEPFELGLPTGLLSAPSVAFNGSLFLVVWQQEGTILGRRVAPDGTVLEAAPFPVMAASVLEPPSVAAVDETFLVVAVDAPGSPQFQYVLGMRVAGDGTLLDGSPLSIGTSFAHAPSVAAFGDRWLVAYQRNFSHDDPKANIRGRILAADGSMLTPDFIVHANFGSAELTPSVAASDSVGLITWVDPRNGLSELDLYGRRILPDGTMLDPGGFGILIAADEQIAPATVWTGNRFLVVEQDTRATTFFLDERSDIYGQRLDASGNPLDGPGFPIATSPAPERDPDLAATDPGRALIVSAVFDSTPSFEAYRVHLLATGACAADLGHAGPGSVSLAVCGEDLTLAGTEAVLALAGATPAAPVFLATGLAYDPMPIKGGVLAPNPLLLLIEGFVTDASGTLQLPVTGGAGPPIGLILQAVVPNGAVFEFSNALELMLGS